MIVGITGGIATGKSTVSQLFRKAGWQVIDADQVAHQVRDYNPQVRRALIERFGAQLFATGKLDTKLLGSMVFDDHQALADLNALLQPLIRQEIKRQVQAAVERPLVLEIQLLVEQHYQSLCDVVVVAATSKRRQLQRLVQRDHLNTHEAQSRIAAQLPLTAKIKQADWVIDNNSTYRKTVLQTAWLIDYLSQKKGV
ncbi:MAG TPA: dephospho-CoA kinase [Candidatus Limosilactobacillus merdipullorum]|uniref:Dephospho-CoA kinase n=1 Tax=Candidatus Limosilactobacillus merdipullorum TaxID=2838653 RepID=A0A9D1U2Z4_9LACO|nr:dephospho-CoA kinase [Candidatus Limosilactobacillus merdipullorum]